MIKAVLPGDGGFLAGVAGPDPYRAIHESLWTLYGGEAGPPRFWQTETGGLLSLSGEALTVSGDFSDPAELAAFCTVCGAKKLRGPRSVTEGAARILGWRVRVRQILSGRGRFAPVRCHRDSASPLPGRSIPFWRRFSVCRRRTFLLGTAKPLTSYAMNRAGCWAFWREGPSFPPPASTTKTAARHSLARWRPLPPIGAGDMRRRWWGL